MDNLFCKPLIWNGISLAINLYNKLLKFLISLIWIQAQLHIFKCPHTALHTAYKRNVRNYVINNNEWSVTSCFEYASNVANL